MLGKTLYVLQDTSLLSKVHTSPVSIQPQIFCCLSEHFVFEVLYLKHRAFYTSTYLRKHLPHLFVHMKRCLHSTHYIYN